MVGQCLIYPSWSLSLYCFLFGHCIGDPGQAGCHHSRPSKVREMTVSCASTVRSKHRKSRSSSLRRDIHLRFFLLGMSVYLIRGPVQLSKVGMQTFFLSANRKLRKFVGLFRCRRSGNVFAVCKLQVHKSTNFYD